MIDTALSADRIMKKMSAAIRRKYPGLRVVTDWGFPSGSGFLNVVLNGREAAVEYHPDRGYGLSVFKEDNSPLAGYGGGADEYIHDFDLALQRLMSILEEAHRPRPASAPQKAKPAVAGRSARESPAPYGKPARTHPSPSSRRPKLSRRKPSD